MSSALSAASSIKRGSADSRSSTCFRSGREKIDELILDASTLPSAAALQSAAPNALYNFRLLEALRSDDPTKVHPLLQDLKEGGVEGQEAVEKAGKLLGMAVKVASCEYAILLAIMGGRGKRVISRDSDYQYLSYSSSYLLRRSLRLICPLRLVARLRPYTLLARLAELKSVSDSMHLRDIISSEVLGG